MPLLRFRGGRPAERTIDTVRSVLDSDESFRGRVAAALGADPHDDSTSDASGGTGGDSSGDSGDPAGAAGRTPVPTPVPPGTAEVGIDPVARLLVLRPPNWLEQWRSLVAAAEAEEDDRRRQRSEHASARRAEAISDRLDRQAAELEDLRSELADLRQVADSERADRARAVDRMHRAESGTASARSERDRAVAELAETRRALADAHEELRSLRRGEDPELRAARLRQVEALEAARSVVVEAASALAGVAEDLLARVDRDLTALAEELGTGPDTPDGGSRGGGVDDGSPSGSASGSTSGSTSGGQDQRPLRRRPIPLRRGVLEGDPDAVDQLVRTPGVVVLVDGYNLGMTVWRSLEPAALRERTVGFLTDVATRTGARVVVVFDGGEVGERLPVHTPLGVRTLYSPTGVEADDVLIRLVGEYPAEQPVVVVSSDRRVRDGVRRGGANPLRSEELWAWSQGPGRS